MKHYFFSLFFLFFFSVIAGEQKSEISTEKRNLAIEFLRVKGTPVLLDNVIHTSVKQQISANRELLPYSNAIKEFYKNVLGFEALKEELGELYASKLSADDLKQLIVFYNTPLGRRYVDTELTIPADLSRILKARSEKAVPDLIKMLQHIQK